MGLVSVVFSKPLNLYGAQMCTLMMFSSGVYFVLCVQAEF